MKLGYLILYVTDVAIAAKFYHDAFGWVPRFIHEGGDYAELETGETTLALASHALAVSNLPDGYTPLVELQKPAGIELALVTDDIPGAVAKALSAGASSIAAPCLKPWGQTVAYVRSPDGCLIELCTPMSN